MPRKMVTIDGNTAAAHTTNEVIAIYSLCTITGAAVWNSIQTGHEI